MKKFIIPLIFILLVLEVVGCTSNSDNPVQPHKSSVNGVWEIVDHEGRLISSELRSDVSTDKGTISGLGFFESGATAHIIVRPKTGYTYKGMYFRYTSGYDVNTYPTTAPTAYNRPKKDITVRGNITVVAILEKSDGSAVIDIE